MTNPFNVFEQVDMPPRGDTRGSCLAMLIRFIVLLFDRGLTGQARALPQQVDPSFRILRSNVISLYKR